MAVAEPIDRMMAALDAVGAQLIPEPTDEELEAMALAPAAPEAPQTERWRITDRSRFVWTMRRLRQLTTEREEVEAAADAQIAHVTAWRTAEYKRIDLRLGYFQALVSDYFEEQRRADPKLKTLAAPDGKVKSRKQVPQWQVTDPDVLVKVLKMAGQTKLVRVHEEPAPNEIKASANMVLTPGPEIGPGLRSYTVTVRSVNEDDGTFEELPVPIVVNERPEKLSLDWGA